MSAVYNRIEQCRQLGLNSRGRLVSDIVREKLSKAIRSDTKRMSRLREGIRKNKTQSAETRKKISDTMKRRGIKPVDHSWYKHHSPETRRKISIAQGGDGTRKPRKYYGKIRRNRMRWAGSLSPQTVQMVYEDNIKQNGTLTCYLCSLPIEMGDDSLEHKTPLSRGGTNEYCNLAIAHLICNQKKNKMTIDEYRAKNKEGV